MTIHSLFLIVHFRLVLDQLLSSSRFANATGETREKRENVEFKEFQIVSFTSMVELQ